MKYLRIIFFQLPFLLGICLLFGFLFSSCAKIGSPDGGPKDTISPFVIMTEPNNFTTNFQDKKIVLQFNEYVQISDADKGIIVSPMLNKNFEIKERGKKIEFTIQDTLKENTTYFIAFKNVIGDYNEDNKMKDGAFVFSTGSVIDTLGLAGNLYSAFDRKPLLDHYVYLYKTDSDSVLMKRKPDFVTKTDSSGRFVIPYIPKNRYQIFAFKDLNSNYIFDQPGEEIAFLDSMVTPGIKRTNFTDTIHIEKTEKDTIARDSIVHKVLIEYIPKDLVMSSFTEYYYNPFLKSSQRKLPYKLEIFMGTPMEEKISIRELNQVKEDTSFLTEFSPKMDSIIVWIKDSTKYNQDTLHFTISYQKPDSNNVLILQIDTIDFYFTKADKQKPKKEKVEKNESPKTEFLEFQVSVTTSKILEYQSDIKLNFPSPMFFPDPKNIHLYKMKDTIFEDFPYKLICIDSMKRVFKIEAKWKENEQYKLTIDSASISDIYGKFNDKFEVQFSYREKAYYSTLKMKVDMKESPYFAELMTEKDIVLQSLLLNEGGKYEIALLQPGKYKLRAFLDKNKNGKWDTGKLSKKLQPEKMIIYKDAIELKSGFDSEIDWKIE